MFKLVKNQVLKVCPTRSLTAAIHLSLVRSSKHSRIPSNISRRKPLSRDSNIWLLVRLTGHMKSDATTRNAVGKPACAPSDPAKFIELNKQSWSWGITHQNHTNMFSSVIDGAIREKICMFTKVVLELLILKLHGLNRQFRKLFGLFT